MGLRSQLLLLAATMIVLPTLGQDAGAPSTPEQLFEQGNRAYMDGRFDDAATAYRSALDFDLSDARLEYNLANAEFKRGHKGQAILHFERARRLDPTDVEIIENLEYARGFIVDRVPAVQLPGWLAALRGLQDRIGPDRHAWLLLALGWTLAFVVAWSLARSGRFGAGWGWTIGVVLAAIAVVALSGWATWQRLDGADLGVVVAPVTEVLAGPGGNNASLATVHEGLTVEVRDVRDDWAQVSLPNGLSGWLPREALEPV